MGRYNGGVNANWESNRFQLNSDDLTEVLGILCVRLGFCSLTDHCTRILASSPLTIDEFTDAVIVGEGMDLVSVNDRLRKQVRSVVAEYYAAATNNGLWWLKSPRSHPNPSAGPSV